MKHGKPFEKHDLKVIIFLCNVIIYPITCPVLSLVSNTVVPHTGLGKSDPSSEGTLLLNMSKLRNFLDFQNCPHFGSANYE